VLSFGQVRLMRWTVLYHLDFLFELPLITSHIDTSLFAKIVGIGMKCHFHPIRLLSVLDR